MIVESKNRRVGEEITCACGCDRKFLRHGPNDKYFCEGCRVRAYQIKNRERAVAKRAADKRAAAKRAATKHAATMRTGKPGGAK